MVSKFMIQFLLMCLCFTDLNTEGQIFVSVYLKKADHSGHAVYGMDCLRPLKHSDRRFESHLRHGCLCTFILIPRPRSPTDFVKRIKKLKKRGQGPTKGCRAIDRWILEKYMYYICIY
jgi:hypothetical protein